MYCVYTQLLLTLLLDGIKLAGLQVGLHLRVVAVLAILMATDQPLISILAVK